MTTKGRWFLIGMLVAYGVALMTAMVRYSVGQPVSVGVYTEPFQEDGIYKFMQTVYLSDPNDPNSIKVQAAPDDWIKIFGNNERTLIFHTLSELRVIQAAQARRLIEMEKDPNDTIYK